MPDCPRARKFGKGSREMVERSRNQEYSKIAHMIGQRPDHDALWAVFERCGRHFADFAFKDEAMMRLFTIMEKIGPDKGTNALFIFADGVLPDARRMEMFIDSAYDARNAVGMDKLLRGLNGVNNVKGVDYPLHFAQRVKSGFNTGVKGFELSDDIYRGVDITLDAEIPLGPLGGSFHGFLLGECKSGPNQVLDATQGLKCLAQLEKQNQSPFLFRFIHNTDTVKFPGHLPKQIDDFAEAISKAANLSSDPLTREAARKVVAQMRVDFPALSSWSGTTLEYWAHGNASRQTVRTNVIGRLRDWFYHQYNVEYL